MGLPLEGLMCCSRVGPRRLCFQPLSRLHCHAALLCGQAGLQLGPPPPRRTPGGSGPREFNTLYVATWHQLLASFCGVPWASQPAGFPVMC